MGTLRAEQSRAEQGGGEAEKKWKTHVHMVETSHYVTDEGP